MTATRVLRPLLFVCVAAIPLVSAADTFGIGDNAFTIDFVTIGSPGNAADTTGDPNPAGAVPYTYRIGKYEIPEHAIRRANAATAATANPLNITLDERGPDKPATRVSWFEAARFVNYLNEDKGSQPAYKFDTNGDFQLWVTGDLGFNPANPFRNALATYFLPSADEWYKAAFYDPVTGTWFDYPNGMNTAPLPVASGTDPNAAVYDQPFAQGPADVYFAGGASPFGTIGQAGNVSEWEETDADLMNDVAGLARGIRGGNWSGINGDPTGLSSAFRSTIFGASVSNAQVGFRIASAVPEPTSVGYVFMCLSAPFIFRWLHRTGADAL